MPITSKFTMMCDEVRIENNGKFIILGVYTPDMAVPQFPAVIPMLTFALWLDYTLPGQYQFDASVTHLESGTMIARAMGGIGVAKAGTGLVPIRFSPVQFTQAGVYTFSIRFMNENEILHQFSVGLPPAPTLPAGLGAPGLTGRF